MSTAGIALAFQLSWLVIVAGAARGLAWAGPAIAVAWIAGALALAPAADRRRVLPCAVASGAAGFAVESALGYAGIHDGLPCPMWLVALWIVFGIAAPRTLTALAGRPALAAIVGALAGPLSYLAGARLGAIVLAPGLAPLFAFAAVWAVALPLFAGPVPPRVRLRALPLGAVVAMAMPGVAAGQAPDALVLCATIEGETAAGAQVVLVDATGGATALTAGEDGCVRIAHGAAPVGAYRATVFAPGTLPRDVDVSVRGDGAERVDVALDRVAETAEEEIVVEARREQPGETRRSTPPELARVLPGTQGDALKAVQNLPGLARTPFGSGGLLVRGAAPGDTKVFLDGQEIPQLYHFGGVTSVVSTELLSSIDFLPGGFGVRFGRATAGVVDVRTRGRGADGWGGIADADIYDAELSGGGPIGAWTQSTGADPSRPATVSVAARRSYIDAVLPQVLPSDALTFTVAPRYYDYQLRWDAPSREDGSTLHTIAYGSDDAFTFVVKEPLDDAGQVRGRFLFGTRFHRVQAPWARPLASGWLLTVDPGLGYQDIRIDAGGLFALEATRLDATLRAEARRDLARVRVLGGVDAIAYRNDFRVRVTASDLPGEAAPVDEERTRAQEGGYGSLFAAAYVEAEVDVAPRVTVVSGLRADGYLPQRQASIDPRVSARYEADTGWFARGYAGVYHQPPLFQEWDAEFGNEDLAPPVAYQLGIGGGTGERTRVEGELFWKWLDDLVVQKPADPANPSSRGAFTNAGIGRAYGAELLVKRDLSSRVYGWLAYTLSRSQRANPYTRGGWAPFSSDQTHILTALVGWKLRDGWELGSRFRYATGNPVTPVAGAAYDSDADVFVPVDGPPGGSRIPAFHQLDVRVDRRWSFRTWSLTAYVDVQNVYVRENAEGVRYDYDYDRRYYVTGLPLLPSIGLRGEF